MAHGDVNVVDTLFPSRRWVTAPILEATPFREPRRIILCFDGTGNQFSEKNSNVLQFFKCLRKDDDYQIVYYQTGMGTYTHPWYATKFAVDLSMKLDAAIAWNLEHHVQDAYRFLMQTYQPGDKISLFGFSRGAYTARVLAGFLQKIGLLPRENVVQIPFAWDVFKNSESRDGLQACGEYKQSFCVSVQIDFMGLWDTVAAVGISGRELPFVSPTENGGVRVFRHALALDERRAKFQPNFKLSVQGRKKKIEDDPVSRKDAPGAQEIWFAGCHCDVGGGSVSNDTRNSLARVPLRWMIRECFRMKTGIIFDEKMLINVGFGRRPFSKSKVSYYRVPCRIQEDNVPKCTVALVLFLWAVIQFVAVWSWRIAKFLLRLVLAPLRYALYMFKHIKHVKSFCARFSHYFRRGSDDLEAQKDGGYADVTRVDEDEEEKYDARSPMYDQLSKARYWWIFELWPLVFRLQDSKMRNRGEHETRVNGGKGREIYGDAWNGEGESRYIEVHNSVFTRMKQCRNYRPHAWFHLEKNERFHWEADIQESTQIFELEKLGGGWKMIRWVGHEDD